MPAAVLTLRVLLLLTPSFLGAARCAVLIILVVAVVAWYVAGTRLVLVLAVEEEEEDMDLAARSCLAITIGSAEDRCCRR